MKKFLLLIAVALFSTATYAQLWNSSISAVGVNDAVNFTSPAAMDKDGNLYVTGTQTEVFTFAGNDVETEGVGAYIAKYNVAGEEQFAIALVGAIDITAITTDADNNFYVAGVYAGEAYITDIEGVAGEYETLTNSVDDSKTAAFIAKYDANGNLLAVKSYSAALSDLLWDPTKVSVSRIIADGENIYLQFGYTGDVELDSETILTSNYINYYDMFYLEFMNTSIVSFDTNMENPVEVAKLAIAATGDPSTSIRSINFTVDGEDVYVAAFGVGNLVLTTSAGAEAIDFSFDGDGNTEIGAILSKVGTKTVVFNNIPNNYYVNFDAVRGMDVREGKLYVAGTFGATCAFDNTKVSTGASDIFVASFDANDLTADWVYANAYDEGATNKFYEDVTAVAFGAEHIYIAEAVTDMDNKVEPVAKNYAVSYAGVANEGVAIPATAIAYNANNVAVINFTDATYVQMFGAELTTAIEAAEAEVENDVVYDLTGRRVEKVRNAGIYIVNGKKVLVK